MVGVAPSRAIYFATYSNSKSFLVDYLPPDAPVSLTHILSAASAGEFFEAPVVHRIRDLYDNIPRLDSNSPSSSVRKILLFFRVCVVHTDQPDLVCEN